MTPFELDILLHYYARADQHRVVRENPPIWERTKVDMIKEELLKPSSFAAETFEIGERGKAYIEHILSIPLPVKQWVIPKGE